MNFHFEITHYDKIERTVGDSIEVHWKENNRYCMVATEQRLAQVLYEILRDAKKEDAHRNEDEDEDEDEDNEKNFIRIDVEYHLFGNTISNSYYSNDPTKAIYFKIIRPHYRRLSTKKRKCDEKSPSRRQHKTKKEEKIER